MAPTLRQATRDDIPAMHRVRLAVRENVLTSTITAADYVDALEVSGRGWVVEADGEIAGFAMGNAVTGNIWAVFVDPAHERRGHGRRLHDAMVEWLFARGLTRLWLSTDPATRARGFYEAAGWQFQRMLDNGEAMYALAPPHVRSIPAIPPHVAPFWSAFAATRDHDPTPRFLEAFHFSDNQPVADELAALVLAGTKRATAALWWVIEAGLANLPRPGNLSVVTDWSGAPRCVMETTRVDIVPFDDVPAEFARVEGEGDQSLAGWRGSHWALFARECRALGRAPDPRMPVICERFDVVFPKSG